MKRFLIAAVSSIAILSAGASVNTASAASPDQVFATLFGAAAGGFIGSHIGSGNGRVAATAAGTLIGAAFAHNATRYGSTSSTYTRTVYRPSPSQIYRSQYRSQYRPQQRSHRRPVVYVDRSTYVDNRTYVTQTNTTVNHTDNHDTYRSYRPYRPHWPRY
ncbi:MAG: glycine zipper 2TM domain-containing protein [Alphaproteobacteria bacterium]|nr:glycine zipper 2TM domain-containing protein [Alphaproteobacteria bacterium]